MRSFSGNRFAVTVSVVLLAALAACVYVFWNLRRAQTADERWDREEPVKNLTMPMQRRLHLQ